MAISRMQNPQQLQGIGSLRQPYGLGKLVKKAFRGVKKIVKSPLGKAALLGGLGMYGMGAGPFSGGKFGAGFLKNIGGGSLWKKLAGSKLGGWFGGLTPGQKIFTGLGGAAIAAPFIQKAFKMGPYQEEEEGEEDDWTQMPGSMSSIVNRAQNYYRQPTSYDDFQFMPEKQFVTPNFYAADGGRAGLLNGGGAGEAQIEQMLRAEYLKYKNQGGTMPYEQFKILVMKQAQQGQTPNQMMEAGGRIGYEGGGPISMDEIAADFLKAFGYDMSLASDKVRSNFIEDYKDKAGWYDDIPMAQGGRAGYALGEEVEQQTDLIEGPQGDNEFQETVVEGQEQPSREQLEALAMEIFNLPVDELDDEQLLVVYQEAMQGQPMEEAVQEQDVQFAANGGVMGGDDDDELTYNPYQAMDMYKRTRKQEGGLMDMGGMEKDYREEGGFVPIGGEERADDVPARLSKNEFVFTADAVRAAGGGDIDRGSEVMQNVMDNLQQGGEVSENSQGLQGGEEIMSEEIIDESNPAQGMYDNYEQLQSRVG